MDVQQQQVVPFNNQQLEGEDYVDKLKPGYRFSPTDVELIVHYLKRKIDTGGHPQCRLYDVNIYEHDPQELADQYRACDGKWYFLTPRERKYSNGKRPNRIIKNLGFWKTSQKDTEVYDDGGQVVGRKRCLAYFDVNGNKLQWLMHEYITNDPNLPVGTSGNKLSDCVLCKIYKKETDRRDNTNHAEQVENTSNQDEHNQQNDEPSTRKRRLSESNQPNEHELVQTQEENHLLGTNTQMMALVPFMLNSNQESVYAVETSGLTPQMGYAQDQIISMGVQEDNLSFDTTRGFTAAMGFDQSNIQEYLVDDNLCFDADELLTTIQKENELVQTQEENQLLGTNTQMVAPMPFMSTSNQESVPYNDTTSLFTAPMGYTRTLEDQTISVEVQEENLSFDTTSGLTDQMGYTQTLGPFQDQSNQLNGHEHEQLQEEKYHLRTDVEIVSPFPLMFDPLVYAEEHLMSTPDEDGMDSLTAEEIFELWEKQSNQCSINSTDDADQEATRPSNVM